MSSESPPSLPPLPEHPHIYGSVLDLIADTALVEIQRLGREAPRAHVFGKLEAQNPGGSVKDRICLSMIERAEKRASSSRAVSWSSQPAAIPVLAWPWSARRGAIAAC